MIRLPSLLALALLAGCAREAIDAPSLAAREAEGRGFAEPKIAPPAAAAPDPMVDGKLSALDTRLATIVAGFDADAALAQSAAGAVSARTVGSEGWIAAQTALAALDDWRAQAGGIETELDDLARERVATTGTAYPALDALRERATAEGEREAAAIAAIGGALPTP